MVGQQALDLRVEVRVLPWQLQLSRVRYEYLMNGIALKGVEDAGWSVSLDPRRLKSLSRS
jgi:hypothetical protein